MVVINNNKVSNNKQRQEPDSVGLSRGSEWWCSNRDDANNDDALGIDD